MMFDDTLISIHAPTRGATILCNHRGLVFGFQSTLPREERLSFPCNISFHLIFQSTLPREERQTMRKLTIAELNFNPRSHERSDPMVKKFLLMKMISIHAPTRGATCNSIRPLCIYEFQSTLPREERRSTKCQKAGTKKFQSTLPREERPCCNIHALRHDDFNPRSHERSDEKRFRETYISLTFQSTLPREERRNTLKIHVTNHIFQSTLPREERQPKIKKIYTLRNFNPRSHERSDSIPDHFIIIPIISIHAPTRGATTTRPRHTHI